MSPLYKPPTKIPCCNFSGKESSSSLSIVPRLMKSFSSSKVIFLVIIMLISTILPLSLKAQSQGNETPTLSILGYSLKKVVSNTTIPSGVNFSYTILFTAPAGATTVNIQDQIPSALVVVNVPAPAIVNGVTPVVATTGPIGSQVVTYSLTSLPAGSPSSGSFTIVVKFPEGTTCNGAAARNRAGIQINSDWNYTGYVSTTATAVDPWVISKSIISGPVVNPNGGNCGYQMNLNTTVIYRLAIMKANGYWGNVVGQMNMSSASVSDIFPIGAVVGTLPAGVTISLNTITWTPNSGLLDAANAWAYYWVDIPVTYPSVPFPIGSFVYNQATLTGALCQQQASHSSNQTCIEIADVIPHPGGYFQKWVSVQNRVPGCPGTYTIYFCNNGNVSLSAFNITDAIPSGVSVTSVQFYNASPATTVNITANGGANTLVTALNTNSWNSGNIGYTVNNLQFAMTGSLPVGQCLVMYVNFVINPNPVGTVVNNCAVFNGLSNGLTLPNACASFTVAAAQPDPCLVKDICAPQTDYEPGDIIRMRLRVQNIGSAALTGATIQDMLNPSFQYLGNESYFISSSYSPPCSTGPGIPAGTTAWTGVTPIHSGNNLSWNIPSIPSACQLFAVAYCGYYGTWGLNYYYIEFDVQVDGSALPGVTPNNYSISGGNLPATVTSNTINVLIVASFGQEAEKQVSTDNGVTFTSTGTVTPGSTAKYRLNYKNTSNVPVSTVNLVDLLARDDGPTNDWLILNRTAPRGSQFEITYAGSPATSILPAISPPVPTINFAAGENICLPPWGITLGCFATTWALSPVTENIRFNNGTFILPSNSKLRQDFNINIPLNATPQQTVCNDFAAISTANFLLNGNPTAVALTPIAAPPICLTVAAANSCCDSVRVEQYFSAAAPGCCARIRSKCEIKSINISLSNGTFSSASWNCGAIPPAYIGQSSFTFAPGTCAPLDMITCFSQAQPGVVIVTYTINFANGQTCTKVLDVNCNPPHINCCDSIKVESFTDPTVPGCCAKLSSTCEIKAVKITLGNGTFFSAGSNCGPLTPGYFGQSTWTFAPGNCTPVELITCLTPIQPGYVIVNYTVYLANGDSCKKVLDLNCTNVEHDCCDSIRISQTQDIPGVAGCCDKIESKCDVEKVNVAVTNGTISSANWSCGPIPAGYIGSSNYTFVAGGCPIDLTTCFNAIVTGSVGITYTVTLTNGEVCIKFFKLNCTAPVVNCCDSVSVVKYSDPTQAGCCIKLHSKCEIKAVKVSLTNGTFSSATSNCATLTPGYAGQSNWTFAPGNCTPVSLITCVNALQTGIVIANYTIYFANGDSCKKVIDLDCIAPVHCCDSVRVESYSSATAPGCCAKLHSVCEIKAVKITLGNGTFSSASSSCGALTPGYIGQSSWTFAPGNCAPVDLITCFTPKQPGYVVVNYTIYFANGDSCKKVLDLNCTPTYNCCDSIRVSQAQSPNGGVLGCCARIKSKCDVQKVNVAVTNGTISSASWNCGAIPAGYVGSSNYTFVANGCAMDLTTCFDATVTGSVGITYTVTLSNGEVCVKEYKLNCTTPVHCCDSVRVESYSNATAPGCCAKLHSVCEIKAVKVTLGNGTFSSASSSCGALTPGYVGQSSWTFAPGNCAPVDLITCFTPKQPGYVVVNYAIYFANGDSCKKVLDLNCTPTYNCCDSIKVSHVQGPNGTVGCCARIKSKCDVQKVDLAITNGTISSANWNCGVIPAGYVGQSNYTFVANGCAMDLTTCFNAIQTGTVSVIYTVTLTDGTVCKKELKFDCTATPHCCDSVKVETIKNPDGTANCCARLKTTCEVKSIVVNVTNGTLGTSSWNCGVLPNGYVGQSTYTFSPNGCIVDLTNCIDAIQSGVVTVAYTITFQNGETCKKTIDLKCNVSTACCAKVDFKLKQKWPFKNQVGIFNITNLDPSSPICKVQIYSAPTATFTPGSLIVDGVSSAQVWNSTSIPATGNLTSPAVNTISFNMSGNYSGLITICVVKCDGTRCCFDFKWNKSPLTGVVISPNQLSIGDKLVAVSVNPKVTNNKESSVKYVSFGFTDQKEVDASVAEFFAISASQNEGEEYPASLAAPVNAYMSRFSAFFELPQPVRSGNGLGAFNLVFSGKLPKLGCTLFSENGDIVFSGNIDVSVNDSVITSSLQPSTKSANLFEFINVYPNPSSDGLYTLTYATGEKRDVEISVVNAAGQVMKRLTKKNDNPGIHKQDVDTRGYPTGIYKMVISSGGKILSKSAVKN